MKHSVTIKGYLTQTKLASALQELVGAESWAGDEVTFRATVRRAEKRRAQSLDERRPLLVSVLDEVDVPVVPAEVALSWRSGAARRGRAGSR